MHTIFLGKEIITLKVVDSTNNYAAKLNKEGVLSDGAVIMAHNQTKGKGQRGAEWLVEPGKNLTFSVVWKSCSLPLNDQFKMSMSVAIALAKYCSSKQFQAVIKWPNDILIEGKKIAGVLIENSISKGLIDTAIIGIGLNVNQECFQGLTATSLKNLTSEDHTLVEEMKVILSFLEVELMKLAKMPWDMLKSEYLSMAYGTAEPFQYDDLICDKVRTGRIINISPSGLLHVKTTEGVDFYDIKQIRFHL